MLKQPRGFGTRLYAALLWLLPPSVREDDGPEMLLTFEDLLRTRSGGVSGGLFTARMILSLLGVVVVEWFDLLRPGRSARAGATVWDALRVDARFLARTFRRDSGLALLIVAIVGLGVGATATVFSVANTLLYKPLPFSQPDQLVWISNGEWGRGQQLSELTVQVGYLLDLKSESRTLDDVAGYNLFDREGDNTLAGDGEPERLTRLRVTPDFFQVLGVPMLHGRAFSADEAAEGGPRAIVLDHGFWRRRFASDPGVVGTDLLINGAPATVVGVLPEWFDFPGTFAPGARVDFVAPFPLNERTNAQGNTLALIGRLAEGADLRGAQAEVRGIVERRRAERRNDFTPWVVPLRTRVTGQLQTSVLVLGLAVGLVMLVVCANLANLLLARGAARQRELAIRSALGADAWRIARQVLTESALLSIAGSVLGIALAVGATRALSGLDLGIPLLAAVRVDRTVLAFGVVLAWGTGILVGVLPALKMARTDPDEVLRGGGRSASDGRRAGSLRSALVVSEVAVTCVLLVGAALLGRSLVELIQTDLGFQPDQAYAVRVDPGTRFQSFGEELAYFDALLDRTRATAGIEGAGITDVLPVAFNRRWCTRATEAAADRSTPCPDPFVRIVSEGYVDAMGLSLVAGRDFTRADDQNGRPVALISDRFADVLWPGVDPIGRSVRTSETDWEVVGVTRGMRHLSPDQEPGPELFLPFRQVNDFRAVHLIVRSERVPDDVTTVVSRTLQALDSSLPIQDLRPVQTIVDGATSVRRFIVAMVVGFAAFTLLLAALGLYGVIAHSVTRRRKEIGIRLALGEAPRRVRRRVLLQTLRLAGFGTVVGLVVAVLFVRSLQSLVYGISPTDPASFVAVPGLLLIVAAVAGFTPALRASRVDAMEVLAGEG